MSYFDLSKYEGLAKTLYYIDGSTVGSGIIQYTNTPSQVSVDTNLNSPGGKISLTSSTSSSPVSVEFPYQFGSTLWSIRAAIIEVFNLSSSTEVPSSLSVEIYRSGVKHSSIWDSSGFGLETQESTGDVYKTLYKKGSFTGFTGDAGTMVEWPPQNYIGSDFPRISGQFGGCYNEHKKSTLQGLYKARIRLVGNTNSVVSFRQMKLTLIWNTPGDEIQKIL